MIPLIANSMSKEDLAIMVKEKSVNFLDDQSDDNFRHLEFVATLISTKQVIEKVGGVDKLMDDLDSTKAMFEMDEMIKKNFNSTAEK